MLLRRQARRDDRDRGSRPRHAPRKANGAIPPAVAPSRARRLGIAAALLGVPALALAAALAWPSPNGGGEVLDHRTFAAGPVDARRVYWVGHSLMNARDAHVDGGQNVIEKLGALAAARGLAYESFDHTLWGSPLSLLYRGRPHSFERSAPELRGRLAELHERGSRYDTMVLTESLPLRVTRRFEHTPYYLSRFACDFQARSPEGRIYFYETWNNLQAADSWDRFGSPARWDWAGHLREERAHYEEIADRASRGGLAEPGLLGRLSRWVGGPTCRLSRPIFLVPVGTVMARLVERVREERWEYQGERLEPSHLVANPQLGWPADWPRDDVSDEEARRVVAALPRRHPGEDVDDIHPSDLGVYLVALVHFSVLYRQSPEGLPPLAEGLSEATAARLQALVWQTVRGDPRAGIAPLP